MKKNDLVMIINQPNNVKNDIVGVMGKVLGNDGQVPFYWYLELNDNQKVCVSEEFIIEVLE